MSNGYNFSRSLKRRFVNSTIYKTFSLLFRNDKTSLLCFIIILSLLLTAVFAEWLAPYDPLRIDVRNRLAPPSPQHLLGTDALGRDLLSRIFWGGRFSLSIAFSVIVLSMLIGVPLGLISGYFGGITDLVIMRAVDILLCFPSLLMAMAIIAVIGSSITNLIIAMSLARAARFSRIVRGSVLSVKENEYVEAAKSYGGGHWLIIRRHIFPNVSAPIIISATLSIAGALLGEAALSFLGLGVPPPWPSWGSMRARAQIS